MRERHYKGGTRKAGFLDQIKDTDSDKGRNKLREGTCKGKDHLAAAARMLNLRAKAVQ